MPDAAFLENYPLYRRFKCTVPATLGDIPKVRIHMPCKTCGDVRTFSMQNDYFGGFPYMNFPSREAATILRYKCAGCEQQERNFTIEISRDLESIVKIGQSPAWEVKPDANISKMLGEHKILVQRGLICESQGYGIGAFGYYRRIVEEIIDDLLEDVKNLVAVEQQEKYNNALALVKTTRVTAEKIELVQELLPPILRPGGMNPLSLLHGVLSEGLHAETDERCLELAAETREIIIFLAMQVAESKSAAKSFTDKMQSLLDKKSAIITAK